MLVKRAFVGWQMIPLHTAANRKAEEDEMWNHRKRELTTSRDSSRHRGQIPMYHLAVVSQNCKLLVVSESTEAFKYTECHGSQSILSDVKMHLCDRDEE